MYVVYQGTIKHDLTFQLTKLLVTGGYGDTFLFNAVSETEVCFNWFHVAKKAEKCHGSCFCFAVV